MPNKRNNDPSLVIRAVWFLFVGWWASGIWLSIAWFLNLTIIGMPLGIKMINLTPKVVSLKSRSIESEIVDDGGGTPIIREQNKEQYSLLVRGVYFLFVGWWLSGIWMALAWFASVTIVGLPLAVWLYSKLPFMVSLYRY
jgi:uncharacterized membrane protein YccF (DUF307 family)